MRSLLLQLILLVAWIGVQGTSAKRSGGGTRGGAQRQNVRKPVNPVTSVKIPVLAPSSPNVQTGTNIWRPPPRSPPSVPRTLAPPNPLVPSGPKPASAKSLFGSVKDHLQKEGVLNTLIDKTFETLAPPNTAKNVAFEERLSKLEVNLQSLIEKLDGAATPETITQVTEPEGLPSIHQKLKEIGDTYEQLLAQKQPPKVPKEKVDAIVTDYNGAVDRIVTKKALLAQSDLIGKVISQFKISEDLDLWSWTDLYKKRSTRSERNAKRQSTVIVGRVHQAIRALKS